MPIQSTFNIGNRFEKTLGICVNMAVFAFLRVFKHDFKVSDMINRTIVTTVQNFEDVSPITNLSPIIFFGYLRYLFYLLASR